MLFEDGQVSLDAQDHKGPVSLAVAAEVGEPPAGAEGASSPKKGRVVVVGDSDFAKNRFVASFFNRDLFVNSVNWLLGDEQLITIERKTARASRAQLTAEQYGQLRFYTVFLIPELILAAGLTAWWSRRAGA
jgi:ABC-type uncharacterized transport system involved in gliding motility auxiliary subunit